MGHAARIVDANRAIALGRHREVPDRDALHRRTGNLHPHRGRTDGDPQHFDRERRHESAADAGHQRDAPDDAAIGVDRDEAVSGGRAIQLVDARQRARMTNEVRREGSGRRRGCVGIADDERRGAQLHPGRLEHAGYDQNGARIGEGAGEHRVVGGQPGEHAGQGLILLSGAGQRAFRRQRVGFRHQDVERDGGGSLAADHADQLRHHRARPRPLTDRREAPLVDLDHRGRHRLRDARREHLASIEPRGTQIRAKARFAPDQDGKRDEDGDSDNADAAEPAPVRFRRRRRVHNSISMPS